MRVDYNYSLNSLPAANNKYKSDKTEKNDVSEFNMLSGDATKNLGAAEKVYNSLNYEKYFPTGLNYSACGTCRKRMLSRKNSASNRAQAFSEDVLESGICPECGCVYVINNGDYEIVNASVLYSSVKNSYNMSEFMGVMNKYIGNSFDVKI